MGRSKFASGVVSAAVESLESRSLFSSTTLPLDSAFRGGVVQTRFNNSGNASESAEAVVALKDGRVAAIGEWYIDGQSGSTLVIAVYNKDGTLSNRFDADGKLTLPGTVIDRLGEHYNHLQVVQDKVDGSLIIEGDKTFMKVKLTGQIDTSFGSGGYVNRITPSNYDTHADLEQMPDGTFREASFDGSVVRLRNWTDSGRNTANLSRAIGGNYDLSRVKVDSAGVSIIATVEASDFTWQTKLFRLTPTLAKATAFGQGGVVDLTAAYTSWANTKGPWKTGDDRPYPFGNNPPPSFFNVFEDAKSGFVITGYTGYISDSTHHYQQYNSVYTPLEIDVSADGKTVKVDSGYVSGTKLTTGVFQDQVGADGNTFTGHVGGAVTTAAGGRKDITIPLPNADDSFYINGYTQAPDGSYYLVGDLFTNLGDGSSPHYVSRFEIIHTAIP